MIAYDKLIKVLDYNMVYSQRLPNDKKCDDHFPGESSHVKAEKIVSQFQTTALFVHLFLLN